MVGVAIWFCGRECKCASARWRARVAASARAECARVAQANSGCGSHLFPVWIGSAMPGGGARTVHKCALQVVGRLAELHTGSESERSRSLAGGAEPNDDDLPPARLACPSWHGPDHLLNWTD
jgi:hypothetical protein